jgi:hypothetical protein
MRTKIHPRMSTRNMAYKKPINECEVKDDWLVVVIRAPNLKKKVF